VTLRSLVPALGALALVAPITAADTAGVKLSGWSDNILYVGGDTKNDDTGTATKESRTGIGFYAQGSITATWQVTDKVSARIKTVLNPGSSGTFVVRESCFAYDLGDCLSWTMGKYINHIGLLAAEPTGLYTVNASLIGYTGLYGNDVIGTSIAYAPKESMIKGSFHITNGYFDSTDAASRAPASTKGVKGNAGHENHDLGFGLDIIADPMDGVSLNLEAAIDQSSATTDGSKGGEIWQIGFNGSYKMKELTVGAEIQYQQSAKDKHGSNSGTGYAQGGSGSVTQGLLMANYALQGSFPVSVTGMYQAISTTTRTPAGAGDAESRTFVNQFTVAVLSNPLKDTNFGLNGELTYFTGGSNADGAADTESPIRSGVVFSLEGIAVF
jgi:hypothetical protein